MPPSGAPPVRTLHYQWEAQAAVRIGARRTVDLQIHVKGERSMAEPTAGASSGEGVEGAGVEPGSARNALGDEAGVTLIELMIALFVLAVGLLAVAGMAGAVATQTRMAGSVAGQTAAGQEVLESLQVKGFNASPEMDTGQHGPLEVSMNSYTYNVEYTVTLEATDLKRVTAVVQGTRELPPDTMRTLVARMDTVAPTIP